MVDQAAIEFKRILESDNFGFTVEIFNGGQLGAETEMVESMALGELDLAVVGDSMITAFAPKYGALSVPYLVESRDHLKVVSESDIAAKIDESFRSEVGTTVVSWWARAPRNLTANRAIETPDELKGLKLRVPTNPAMEATWAALGANPTAVPMTELFVSLQQGVVDAQENPIDTILATNFDEVQTHLMLTEHLYAPYLVLAREGVLESMTQEQLTALQDAVTDAGLYLETLIETAQEEGLVELQELGMTVVEPDVDQFRTKLYESGVLDELANGWAPNLVEQIQELR